jgi:hypothetical protein
MAGLATAAAARTPAEDSAGAVPTAVEDPAGAVPTAVEDPAAAASVVVAARTEEAGEEGRAQAVPVEVLQEEEGAAATAKNKLARRGTTAPPGHFPAMFIVLTSTSTPPGAS